MSLWPCSSLKASDLVRQVNSYTCFIDHEEGIIANSLNDLGYMTTIWLCKAFKNVVQNTPIQILDLSGIPLKSSGVYELIQLAHKLPEDSANWKIKTVIFDLNSIKYRKNPDLLYQALQMDTGMIKLQIKNFYADSLTMINHEVWPALAKMGTCTGKHFWNFLECYYKR
jgi:hypothetical protein